MLLLLGIPPKLILVAIFQIIEPLGGPLFQNIDHWGGPPPQNIAIKRQVGPPPPKSKGQYIQNYSNICSILFLGPKCGLWTR